MTVAALVEALRRPVAADTPRALAAAWGRMLAESASTSASSGRPSATDSYPCASSTRSEGAMPTTQCYGGAREY